MKKKIIWAAMAIAIIGGGWVWYSRSQQPDEGIELETIRRGDVAQTLSATGGLVPRVYADISFLSSGVIDKVFYDEGDSVLKGDVIATLDSNVLESQIRAAYLATETAVAAEQLARRTWDDLKPEERRSKKIASEQARENIRTLYAQLEQRKLIAPIDGYITKSDLRVGEVASAAVSIMRISEYTDDFVLEARIPESDIAEIKIGMKAIATFDAFSRKEKFSVEVFSIESIATVVQDVVSYKTKFLVHDRDPRFRDGMTADIDIETTSAKNVLLVPFRAIIREGEKNFVEVRRAPEQFDRVEVSLGIEGDGGMIEAKSGLKEGDEVVVSRK